MFSSRKTDNQSHLFFMMEVINCLCYFAPLSFIAIFLYEVKHLDKVEIGISMLLGVWASRGSRILLAPFMDKIQMNRLVPGLQLLGAIGYLLILNSTIPVFLSIFLISICYGNNSMLIRVLINQTNNATHLSNRFALLHVATNLAAMLGPLAFNIITLYFSTTIAFQATAIALMFSALYSYKHLANTAIPKQESYFKNIKFLLAHNELLKVYCLIVIAYFFYAQIFSLAPILLANTYGLKSYIWAVGFLNSIVSVLFAIKINDFFRRSMPIYGQIITGFIFAILGFSFLVYVRAPIGIMSGVIFISLAEIAFIPGFQVILSNKTRQDQKVAIFAINALCMGIGEGFGQYYGVFTSLGQNNFYAITLIYCILLLGIYLSLTLKKGEFLPQIIENQ